MPRSRSRSLVSMTRSATRSLARKTPALAEHRVDERGLAVVDVGDDGDVAAERIGDGAFAHGGRSRFRHPFSIQGPAGVERRPFSGARGREGLPLPGSARRGGATSALGMANDAAAGQRVIELVERVDARTDVAKRDRTSVTFEHLQRPQEVPGLAAPAAADFEVLPVDVVVRVDGARPGVGVVPGDDIAAAIADERPALPRPRPARRRLRSPHPRRGHRSAPARARAVRRATSSSRRA